jgi:histidinol phosphatase-like PHP family hydrolase
MTEKPRPLLCELHAHTTWSDGALSVRELIDLYGRSGFDVLAITDHTVAAERVAYVRKKVWPAYLAEIEAEAERARRRYDLLVLPGLELTVEHRDPRLAAHAVAVGLRSFVGVADGLEAALGAARANGAALVAAHPDSVEGAAFSYRRTARWAAEPELLVPLVDRFELFNRHQLYSWVAEAGLPTVASGDFHRLEHLHTWKTLLPCAKDEAAVVEYLRSARPAYLVRLDAPARLAAA